jgi:hypothetical protein
MPDEEVKRIRRSLMTVDPDIFGKPPILFAYLYGSYARGFVHPFSDLDIAIYIEKIPCDEYLELELSLSLEIDNKIGHGVTSEVRIINALPLVITGNIITEGVLILSRNEIIRIDFETSIRNAYFDFLPVIRMHQSAYVDSIKS